MFNIHSRQENCQYLHIIHLVWIAIENKIDKYIIVKCPNTNFQSDSEQSSSSGPNMDNLDHIGIKEYHEIFKNERKKDCIMHFYFHFLKFNI